MPEPSLSDVARSVEVSPDTLRRWTREGIVPLREGRWTPAAVAQARIVARLRERGHSLDEVRAAAHSGRLAFGYMEDLFPPASGTMSLGEAARDTGLEPALIRRIWTSAGFSSTTIEEAISEDDVQLLRYMAAVLSAGFPLVAFLQLVRVYGQALAQIADAEVKLFHLFVHEPLIRDGVDGLEIAEEMEGLASELLPLAAPIMDHVHQRWLQHFIEQDVVGHLELEVDGESDLGRLRVGIAFADLAGYTRLTEEAGEEEALDIVERFVEAVEETLPEDARVIKTIGDEVMVVGSDPSALVDWAVGFQLLHGERPLPRIGIHAGGALYRDGDYYGREVNLASRVVARARGGEVVVTDAVAEAV
ncbi:MAG: MerR family transcriptional regulator, partial [Solirubrobacteraceae bacterium]